MDILCGIVKENFAVRDAVEGEKVVQSTVVALLRASGGPYFVRHEGEAGGCFYDIALKPRLLDWPDIAHAAIIELKYLKAGGRKPTKVALAAIKAEAIDELDRYAADPALAAEWRLKPMQNAQCTMHNGENDPVPTGNLKAQGADFKPEGRLNAAVGGHLMGDSASVGVSLHRLVLVFHGGDCILHDEV